LLQVQINTHGNSVVYKWRKFFLLEWMTKRMHMVMSDDSEFGLEVDVLRRKFSLLCAEIWVFIFVISVCCISSTYEIYEVRQFNSWKGPGKAKCAYLYTSSCCHLQNVKLCTSWDDGVTVGNSIVNCFTEYFTVTSHCVKCWECLQIFVPSGRFLIFGKIQKLQGVKPEDWHGWSIFVIQQMNIVSDHLPRFKAPSLWTFFSFPDSL
jgi:hypothetical protein